VLRNPRLRCLVAVLLRKRLLCGKRLVTQALPVQSGRLLLLLKHDLADHARGVDNRHA
jgi:hypothetical protein